MKFGLYQQVCVVVILALLVTAVDIHFSTQLGLLANPPYYDGIGYMLNAKSLFHWSNASQFNLESLKPLVRSVIARNTLWQSLMILSFALLGDGEWQAYTVRFWPTLFALLLVLFVIRHRGGGPATWPALVFTSLLPTISVGLRSSGWEYLTGTVTFGYEWYLSDLRADLLFAVLLLWACVPLLENGKHIGRRVWLASGAFAGLAVLVKPSGLPELFFAWGLAGAYVFLINRKRFSATSFLSALRGALVPFAILVAPWVLAGGAYVWIKYVYQNAFVYGLYSNPNANFVSEFSYYWALFPFHMGHVEAWTMLVLGIALACWSWRKSAHIDSSAIGYLGLSAALYVLVSVFPAKNYFIGLPFYFLLWLFSWRVLAPILKVRASRRKVMSFLILLIICAYSGIVAFGGFYALSSWPAEERWAGPANRMVTQQIAADLRTVLTSDDTFVSIMAYGYPAALQYYMVDGEGRFPRAILTDPFISPNQVVGVLESTSSCKAILVYEEDVQDVAQYSPNIPTIAIPLMRAIAEWVRRPDSSFRAFKTYHVYLYSLVYRLGELEGREFGVTLYVKQSATIPASGLGSRPSRLVEQDVHKLSIHPVELALSRNSKAVVHYLSAAGKESIAHFCGLRLESLHVFLGLEPFVEHKVDNADLVHELWEERLVFRVS